MPASKVQLTGGQFQDSEGNLLVNGYLKMKLSQDGNVAGVGQVCSGIEITIRLNASASVDTVTPQLVWGNDQMLPPNSFYKVTGHKENGQTAWGPNNQQVVGDGGTFDVGTWIPNQIISWTPPLSSAALDLNTNSVRNPNQGRLNFEDSATVTWAVDGSGNLEATASTGPPIAAPSSVRYAVPSFNGTTTFEEAPSPNAITMGTGGIGATTITSEQPTVSAPGFMKQVTPASTSNAAVFASTSLVLRHGFYKAIKMTVAIFSATSLRSWICPITDVTVSTATSGALETDIPTQALCGFRYSTAAGDTNWMAVCNTAAGAQTLVDTGVAPDPSGVTHVFETRIARGIPGTILFFIDGTQVATINTNVPVTNTQYGVLAYVECLAAVAQGIGWSFTSVEAFQ